MTNEELLEKLNELEGYQIGLHNINMAKYNQALKRHDEDEYKIFQENICEEDIAKKILKEGLNVSEAFGLKSTVYFFSRQICPKDLDYSYYSNDKFVVNIIVALPRYLKINGTNYFIGDMEDMVSISSMLLFRDKLISEFIYGYYIKEVTYTGRDKYGYNIDEVFSENLSLTINPNFYEFLSQEEKNNVIRNILKRKRRILSAIKLANNDNLIFLHPSKYSIINTRNQRKRLLINSNPHTFVRDTNCND